MSKTIPYMKDAFRSMQSGRDLSRLVAERVFGLEHASANENCDILTSKCKVCTATYSTDLFEAMKIFLELADHKPALSMTGKDGVDGFLVDYLSLTENEWESVWAPTIPEVMCRFGLLATLDDLF